MVWTFINSLHWLEANALFSSTSIGPLSFILRVLQVSDGSSVSTMHPQKCLSGRVEFDIF